MPPPPLPEEDPVKRAELHAENQKQIEALRKQFGFK
jgi:hypothetical protein